MSPKFLRRCNSCFQTQGATTKGLTTEPKDLRLEKICQAIRRHPHPSIQSRDVFPPGLASGEAMSDLFG